LKGAEAMAQLYKPVAWINSHRKEHAHLAALRDPLGTLKPYRAAGQSRQLDAQKAGGVAAFYCDGKHLYADTVYHQFLFTGYQQSNCAHPGLHLVRRADFQKARCVTLGTTNSSDDTFFFLRHDGFSGEAGDKTARIWFATGSQYSKPWQLHVKPGHMLNIICDGVDWHLETIWIRTVCMRENLLMRSRNLACGK
jgi:hypothetical protein